MKKTTIISWILQVLIAAIFAMAVFPKLTADPLSVGMFEALGMEPTGRILIGVLEGIAVVLILIPASVAWGALLAWGIMLGAFIAHVTTLGFTGDAGAGAILAIAVLIMSTAILALRRQEIPLIGNMFECEKVAE